MRTTPAKARFATNPYPVDSATRSCCGGIGGHTPDCAANGPALPAGAVHAQPWDNKLGTRQINSAEHSIDGFATVAVYAIQTAAGDIVDGPIPDGPEVFLEMAYDAMTPGQARELAAALIEAADLADAWLWAAR